MKTFPTIGIILFICLFHFQHLHAQSAIPASNPSLPAITILDEDCIDAVPALSSTSPDPFRKGYLGVIAGGLTLQSRTRLSGNVWNPDGNFAFSAGLGQPEKWVGLELRVNIYGLRNRSGAPDNFGEGTIDLHLTRKITNSLWIGAGVYDLTGWSNEEPNQLNSLYIVATKRLELTAENGPFHALFVTGGAGNGRFRTDENYTLEKESPWGIFGSAAIQVLPGSHFILEYTGYNMFTGISVIPFRQLPMQFIAGMDDLFHEKRRFIAGASIAINLGKDYNGSCPLFPGLPSPPPPQTSRI